MYVYIGGKEKERGKRYVYTSRILNAHWRVYTLTVRDRHKGRIHATVPP